MKKYNSIEEWKESFSKEEQKIFNNKEHKDEFLVKNDKNNEVTEVIFTIKIK